MANLRFHEKYHGTLHHTVSSPGIPGSGTDPIASKFRPFVGDFHSTGGLSATTDATILGDLALGMNTSDATCRLALTGGTTQAEGIQFGTDTFLYRNKAWSLRTSGAFQVDSNLACLSNIKIYVGDGSNRLSVNTENTGAVIVAETSDATNILNLKAAGADVFGVASDGSMKLGGNVPDQAYGSGPGLEIAGTEPWIRFDGTSGGYTAAEIYTSNQGLHFTHANSNRDFIWSKATTEFMRLQGSDGHLGIGTTSPDNKLHVKWDDFGYVKLEYATGKYSGLQFDQAGSTRAYFLWDDNRNVFDFYAGGGSSSDIKMSVSESGTVGIGTGTSSHAEMLHVKHGHVLIENTNSSVLRLKTGASDTGYLVFGDSAGDPGQIHYNHTTDTLSLATGSGGTSKNRVQILSDGKVVVKDPGESAQGASPIIGSYLIDIQGSLVQSTAAASTFYSVGFRRSSSSLSNPDIYDLNGYGLVLGRNSSSPTLTISNSTSATEYVEGVGINMAPEGGRALTVSGHTKMYGDLTVTGDMTTVTGEVTIQDPVIQLGTYDSDTAADGYDRGCMVVYDNDNNSGTPAISGFFGMERDTSKFVYYSQANFDTGGNNANSSTSTLGSLKMASIEAMTQIYSYGGLRVDENSHLTHIKECSTADVTTLNASYIKPLLNDKLYIRSENISLLGTSDNYPTVAIGKDASLVNQNYQLYVEGSVFLHQNTSVRDLYFVKYTGAVKPNSNNSSGNLHLMVNGGNDNQVRHATAVQMRDSLGLKDSAITTVADIRAPLLKTAGGALTGALAVTAKGTYSGLSPAVIAAYATASGGQAFNAYCNDVGRVLISKNRSASNAEQFTIRHHYGETHITSKRGNLRIAGGTSATVLDSSTSAWHLKFSAHSTSGLHWSNGTTDYQIYHTGNLDPQAYGVHTLQPNYVFNGGSGFAHPMTGTVTLNQSWLNHCVRRSKTSAGNTAGVVWSTETHGPGSGLNADLLDNLQASSFARVDSKSMFKIGFSFTTGRNGAGTTSTKYPWNHYAIYREGAHAGDNPYRSIEDGFRGPAYGHAKLAINWHRGINIRTCSAYGGLQIYGNTYNHSMVSNLNFSVSRGDVHARTHGNSQLRHREDNGTEYKYLHEGNMGSLVNANTFDGQDSVDFMKKHPQQSGGENYHNPSQIQSAFRHKLNGYWNTKHSGHTGQMLSWGTDSGSCSRVQLWSNNENNQHLIRTVTNNDRWSNWTKLWTANNLTNLSQLSNNRNYVRCTLHGEYNMDQTVNKNNNVVFNGVQAHWFKLHTDGGSGIEIAPSGGTHYTRFDGGGHTHRAKFHKFLDSKGNNMMYLHSDPFIRTGHSRGNCIFYTGIEFRTHPGQSDDSDVYALYKHHSKHNSNELRLVIGDDRGNEAFSIWDGNRWGRPEFRSHYFRNDGYTEISGQVVCKGLNSYGQIFNRSGEGSYGRTYLESWGLYNPTHNIYIEPKPGKNVYIVPYNWSHNLHTEVYGKMNIGGPAGGWNSGPRGLSVYGNLHTQSNVRAGGDVIAYYSDRRLKKDLKQLTNSSDIIKKLTGYKFAWNTKAEDLLPEENYKEPQVGLIAQDVEDVLPEAVTGNGPRDLGYKTIKYDKLVPVLIEALKEEMSKTEELEARLSRLEKLISNK